MRQKDLSTDEKVKASVRARNVRTISGLLVVIAGLVFAFVNVESARMGFVVALIGAGIIEPSHIISFLSRKNNAQGK